VIQNLNRTLKKEKAEKGLHIQTTHLEEQLFYTHSYYVGGFQQYPADVKSEDVVPQTPPN